MKNRCGKIILYLAMIFVAFTLVMFVECLIFQFPALRYKTKPISITISDKDIRQEETLVELSEDEIRSITVQRENEKMLAEYRGETYKPKQDDTLVETENTMYRKVKKLVFSVKLEQPYYVHDVDMRLGVESATGYRMTFFLDGQVVGEDLYCSIEPKIGAGIANVNRKINALEAEISTAEKIKAQDIALTLSNQFSPNKMRIFFLTAVLFLGFLILGPNKALLVKPEWVFTIVCFVLGLLIICGIGTNQLGYDEYVHAKESYKMSFGTTVESTESVIQMCGNLLPHFSNPKERKLVEAYEDKNHDYSWADIGHQSRIKRAENRVYYPMSFGFYLARKLHASFALTIALAKLGNLLFYIFVVFWAIRLADRYQYIVTLIGLLPNCIFLASSISYDAMVNGLLLLGSVLILNELMEPKKKLRWQNALMILLCFFIGSIAKPIYIVMALMLLFFPKEKFYSRWQQVIFGVSVVCVTGLMLYNIFCPTPSTGSDYYLVNNLSFAGDKRNVGTSVIGQLQYIIGNPLTFLLLVLKSMWEMFAGYFFGSDHFLQYAYAGSVSKGWMYLLVLVAVWISLFRKKGGQQRKIGAKYVILNLIMIFGMSGIIWSSMYVSYTSVGADHILGVQGRYFIPLFLPFAACLMNNTRFESRQTESLRSRIVFGVSALVNLYMIWNHIILKMNI